MPVSCAVKADVTRPNGKHEQQGERMKKPFCNTKHIMEMLRTDEVSYNSFITAAQAMANHCEYADVRIAELETELAKYKVE